MLPRLDVLDNVTERVDGDTVTLSGEATRPIVKSNAQAAVKSIGAGRRLDDFVAVNAQSEPQRRPALTIIIDNQNRCHE